MSTVADIVLPALQDVGMNAFGLPPGAYEVTTAIEHLNRMLAGWSTTWCNMFPYNEVAPASGDGSSLTLGTDSQTSTAGDFPERPASISAAFVEYSGLQWEIGVHAYEDYRAIRFPGVAAIPRAAYHLRGFPFDTLYLFPKLMPGYSLRVVGRKYLPHTFETITDYVPMPPEYIEAARWNLSLRLATAFRMPLAEGAEKAANSSLKHIKATNVALRKRPQTSEMSPNQPGSWNYLSGWGF